MRLADLADARVAIWGYGREGRAALAALRQRFPRKELTVFCSEAEAASIAGRDPREAQSAPLTFVTSAPDASVLRQFDVVIKSPGISAYKSPLPEAEAAGVRFTSGTALWFAEHPQARTICVTGTKGKSTVTALIAHILRKSGKCVALAGNIGMPLLDLLAPVPEPDWWVIELSSFQTRDFDGAPTVAVINNLYEEHLDWHGTREHYAADKLAIAARAHRLVVNAQQSLLAATASHPARSVFGDAEGWHVANGTIRRGTLSVLPLSAWPLPGLHNALNVCAALAAIEAAGFDATALARHATTFRALPHRLQVLGRHDGVDYVNDSISTTPYATIEALRSLGDRPVTVLVGGFDRGVDWGAFVEHVAMYPPCAIVATGANGERIVEALCTVESPGFTLVSAPTLDKVLECARSLTPAGGTILLSPGAPSFDAFRDYAERGREFARLAGFDPAAIAQIEGLGIA
jgi:UDP-N-acetylmuramoylalanine--D-glutamate ligase